MQAKHGRKTKINFTYASSDHSFARRSIIRAVEKIGGQPKLKRLYTRYLDINESHRDFYQSAIDLLKIDVRYNRAALDRVPREGPVVFIANHPYGVLDGIVLTWMARQVRSDVKVMANDVLCQAPDARNNLLPINFSGTPEATRTNLESRVFAQRALREGGSVGIFPAGGVAASEKPFKGPAVDTPWHPFTAKLINMSKATVVPLYFAGQNSRLFQMASHTSHTLRLSLFFWETARRIGTPLNVAIGSPIPFQDLAEYPSRLALVRELRRRTYALASTISSPLSSYPSFDREFNFPSHMKF